MASPEELVAGRIKVEDSIGAVNRFFYERGWSDGLPVIPPTEEKVLGMLRYSSRPPQHVVARIPPRWALATVEKIAINAVMAGCLPEYLQVVIAAVEAMAEESFNLYSIQATTHPCGPLLIVNGPIAQKLDINSGYGAFGPGWRANATIGRAIRLILMNIGGGIPGALDKSTQAQPSKYTYCIAENEAENPWQPLHVERGFDIAASTVTVVAAEGPHNINDHDSTTAKGILKTVVGSMTVVGSNNFTYPGSEIILCLGPEHAATIAADGFSKDDIKSYILENAKIPLDRLSEESREQVRKSPELRGDFGGGPIPIALTKDDIVVIVVGGAGKHSSFIPTFGLRHRSATKPIPVIDDLH